MPFKIVRNDITKMNTEAIVNTANAHPTVGTGCDRAVYMAAGHNELLAYRKKHIGFMEEGSAFITPGFRLQAKYIIHAVSPLYRNGKEGEEEKLRSCYRKSLEIAAGHRIRSIAFPLISTGGFGYPKEEGMRIAVDEIHAFLLTHEMEIYLVVFDSRAVQLGGHIYADIEEYIDHHYIAEKREEEYGDTYYRPVGQGDIRYGAHPLNVEAMERRAGRQTESLEFTTGALPPAGAEQKTSNSSPKAPFFRKMVTKLRKVEAPPEIVPICESKEPAPYFDFEEQYGSRLEERMMHISDTFSQYLMYLIQDKKMKNADVWKRAIIDKKTFSKIKNNSNYHPQKLTALCLCVGAKLNLDESKDLLARAGYALSPCDKTDIIFSYFIENEIYDMIELDIQLEEHGLPCIIS